MEHRLIQGGEQYLPFARSRIKALRAAGLSYASREWIMPGGEFVQVRIEGEQQFIRLQGGGFSLSMDSGVIDLKSQSAESSLIYANGTRQETDSTAAYTADYVPPSPATGRWASYRSWPAGVPFGQFAGTVEAPHFAGHVRTDATRALSFEAARQPANPPTDPQTSVYNPADAGLMAKKLMASSCAASVFTGRCRLYVQAMYGRHLYEYGSDTSLQPKASTTLGPSLASTDPPQLSVPAYRRPDDTQAYAPVTIGTSAGVRFDPATGRHWLMVIAGGNLNVYPLVSSKIGERLRPYLAGAKVNDSAGLPSSDIEKLEAYVLAFCLPDVRNSFVVAAGSESSDYSMGYGWHWNWSGSAADIVTTTEFDQGPSADFPSGSTAMESTHRRITVAVTDGIWSASKTVVEGPARWAVNRLFWCIAEPQWSDRSTLKSTPQHSEMFDCDAPFYAFYRRDELVLCRMQVTIVPEGTQSRTFSVNFASPVYGSVPSEFTGGMLDGFCEDAAATAKYYTATISCGDLQISDLVIGKTTTFSRWNVSGKTETVPPARVAGNDQSLASGATATLSFGYDAPYGTLDHVTVVGPGILSTSAAPTVEFTREFSTGHTDVSSTLTAVIPFDDAQAIFVDGAKLTTDTRTGRQVSVRDSLGFVAGQFWIPTGGAQQLFRTFLTAGTSATIVSSSTPADIVTTTTTDDQELACIAGTIPATMGELGSFHNDQDYASVSYSVLTGASDTQPVALSAGNAIPPVGILGTVPTHPAIVGWV